MQYRSRLDLNKLIVVAVTDSAFVFHPSVVDSPKWWRGGQVHCSPWRNGLLLGPWASALVDIEPYDTVNLFPDAPHWNSCGVFRSLSGGSR